MNPRTPLHTGGCQCGSIRYAVFASPSDGVIICHCRMCQKALGSSSALFVGVNLTDFQWTRGSAASFQSSSVVQRLFCARCGTPLAYQAKQAPLIYLHLGSFDQPQHFGKPQMQIGVESCLGEWALVPNVDGKRTDQVIMETVVSYQHPDEETTEVEWQQHMSKNQSAEQQLES